MHLHMDLVWHQAHHALSRNLMPPPPTSLSLSLRSRVRALSISVALSLSVVRACTRLCADTWNMCAGEREKRIAEKGRTHQLPRNCPRRSSCTQSLRCRHTHRQPAWFKIQEHALYLPLFSVCLYPLMQVSTCPHRQTYDY